MLDLKIEELIFLSVSCIAIQLKVYKINMFVPDGPFVSQNEFLRMTHHYISISFKCNHLMQLSWSTTRR